MKFEYIARVKKKITIHDLARILKKDSSTISRALADSPRVKKKTRDLIQQKAKELGYTRNTLASNFRSQKTQTIGVVVPHISRQFFSTVIAGIEEVAFEKGYRVIIGQSQDHLEREIQLIDTLLSSQVDGIIMSISMETTAFDHLQSINKDQIPVVFIDRKCTAIPATNLLIDDFARAFEATEHLITIGRRSIAHFTGSQQVSIYQDRKRGYLSALKKNNLPVEEALIFESDLKPKDGEMLALKIIKMGKRPDAILSANDLTAISAMQALQNHGIKVPDDISIFGFSNEPIGSYTSPTLSSVNQNPFNMGKRAVLSLINQIETKTIQDKIVTIDSELILRESSESLS